MRTGAFVFFSSCFMKTLSLFSATSVVVFWFLVRLQKAEVGQIGIKLSFILSLSVTLAYRIRRLVRDFFTGHAGLDYGTLFRVPVSLANCFAMSATFP